METIIGRNGEPLLVEPCRRCNGRGSLPHYGHVLRGVCFRCNGSGLTMVAQHWQRRVFASLNRLVRTARSA